MKTVQILGLSVLLFICSLAYSQEEHACDYDGCAVSKGVELVCRAEDVDCTSWLLIPGWNSLPKGFRIGAYAAGLVYCFLGIAVVADIFMSAIEQITSKEYVASKEIEGRTVEVRYRVWNATMANLTLLSLGTSAPEILLAIIDTINHLAPPCSSMEECADAAHAQVPPKLGASTIVGSAAFNLMMISAVCMVSVPRGEVRRIENYGVFVVTALFSLLAYVWLYYVLDVNTRDSVDLTEAITTLAMFPLLLIFAYIQSKNCFCRSNRKGFSQLTNVELRDLSDESKVHTVAKKLLEQKLHSGSYSALSLVQDATTPIDPIKYRINATRQLTGKRRVIPQQEFSTPIPELEERVITTQAGEIQFAVSDVAAIESTGTIAVNIERRGGTQGQVSVRCFSSPGTATADLDYESVDEIITFRAGEKQKTIHVRIIDDDEVETDETFFLMLALPTGGATLGNQKVCTVTIIDNDSPGVLQFETPTTTINEDVGAMELAIVRCNGTSGRVAVQYKTVAASAVAGRDYEHSEGIVVFDNGEARKLIKIRIMFNAVVDLDRAFAVVLFKPQGHPTPPLIGPDRGCMVTIVDNDHAKQMALKVVDILAAHEEQSHGETSTWGQQFREAVTLEGEVDWAGNKLEPSFGDYVLHLATLGWKVLFAFIPPTRYLGGWAAFFVSLLFIGLITAVVAEFAELFGCVIGMSDSITALTFVAIGTSLPDTFASRQATRQAANADAAIGNITGSNSVNVFLGLGLPWVIASVYHHLYRKDTYTMPAGDLGYSVLVFLAAASGALVLLFFKRSSCLGGGELGGSLCLRVLSFLILFALWLAYVVLASMNAAAQP